MKKWLGALTILFLAGTAGAATVKLYPGASVDAAETGHFQSAKAKSSPALQAQMGQQTFYTTPDSFAKVYDFYKKLYPETDTNIKKSGMPLHGEGTLSDAYFCLDGAHSVRLSKYWLKIQHPFISTISIPGAPYRPKIEDVTVITVTLK